jgi:hypothetical protein
MSALIKIESPFGLKHEGSRPERCDRNNDFVRFGKGNMNV